MKREMTLHILYSVLKKTRPRLFLVPEQLRGQRQAQEMPPRGKVVLEKGGKEVQPLGMTVLTRRLRPLKVVAMQ